MSMICSLIGLTQAQIAAVRATPTLAGEVAMAGGFGSIGMPPIPAAAWRALLPPQTPPPQVAAIGPFERLLDLEKSWHMLHYLLSGHPWPVGGPGEWLLSGQELGDDLGYGPARLQDEAQTSAFAAFMARIEIDRLLDRVDVQEMMRAEIYSMPLGPAPAADYQKMLRTEVATYFPPLRDYVAAMAGKGDGLLIWLS